MYIKGKGHGEMAGGVAVMFRGAVGQRGVTPRAVVYNPQGAPTDVSLRTQQNPAS